MDRSPTFNAEESDRTTGFRTFDAFVRFRAKRVVLCLAEGLGAIQNQSLESH
jgi:hypothetical protein